MSEEINLLLEEFVESEVLCNKSRQIYSELENILIRKDYLQNHDSVVSQSGGQKLQDVATTSSSCHTFINKSSSHKIKPNCSQNFTLKKHHQPPTPDNKNCFVVLQNKIHQFESYKNCVAQVHNKYASEFISLLETQNDKLSTEIFETKSDSS